MNKPFQTLTQQGKILRLRRLAIHALEQYDLEIDRVQKLGWLTNIMFRVRTVQGQTYAMRLCAPGWRSLTDIRSEAMWLHAINQETDIPAPRPIPARNGEFVIEAPYPGIPDFGRCLLMTWIPGKPLDKQLTEGNLYKMGELFARLHEFSSRFTPPPGFTRRKMDHYLARDEENVLFTGESLSRLGPHEQEVLRQTNTRVEVAFHRLYADPAVMRVIHNDLWHGNIKVYRGRLLPFDFEDTIWGYPVQDIAMAMLDLLSDVPADAYEPLLAAFHRGYVSLLPWPEAYAGQMDDFCAGRLLWVANFVARRQSQYFEEHIRRLAPRLEKYLETGLIRKQFG